MGTRRDREEKNVLVNTPTFTWAYTRTFKEGEFRNSTSVVFPMKWDAAVYLNEKKKLGYEKYSQKLTSQEKLKMRHWVNSNCS
jgi:hypothetical protein